MSLRTFAILNVMVALFGIASYVGMMRRQAAMPLPVANAAENVDFEVPDFCLTERSGEPVSRHDLEGKVWIASFVYTRCTTQCPMIFGTMARLQHEFKDEPDVYLVSISVDPERDTPEELDKKACACHADQKRWLFLTGERDPLYGLIQNGFRLTVMENQGEDRKPGDEVMHDFRLVVVDRRGHIRGYFDGRSVDPRTGEAIDSIPRLKQKVAELLREAVPS